MPFVIQELNWYKRRKPNAESKPVDVEVEDFKLEKNHFCKIHVIFDDGGRATLQGRVTQNPVTGAWSVNGINAKGQSVSALYVEDAS
ncbi:hypothetical protein [Pseudidiomarina sp. CB1]|uniref:hypothetical protein n=1 Tax=Pseudidiomarina sp. CB1 TaxID=2972484 RepID=UPI0021613A46|nr:hypothetical protein [Pseudidiomarina sp. CB1]